MERVEGALRWFVWIGGDEITANADLRSCGWRLRALPELVAFQPDCPILLHRREVPAAAWRRFSHAQGQLLRRWTMVFGIEDGAQRARLLGKGFGDVVSGDILLAETQARARRISDQAAALQRWRRMGLLRLDLVQREAFVSARPLGLHPREFAVLWRLMETPGLPVEKRELLRDVWQMSYVPETNSVAVHASRLRNKMAAAGLAGWIQTTIGGGYQIAMPDADCDGETDGGW
jgi:hypothetical protein